MHDDRAPSPPVSPRHVALGVHAPMAAAANELLQRPVDDLGEIDLSRTLVIAPTARASRQLLLMLDEAAVDRAVTIVPPRVGTPSGLLSALSPMLERPVAELETWWSAVADILGRGGPAAVSLVAPESGAIERRATARTLVAADRRLRAGLATWESAAEAATMLGGDPERYRAIGTVVADAERRLERIGLLSPEEAASSRLSTLRDRPGDPETRDFDELVLLGLVDPTRRDRAAIQAAADAGVQVSVFSILDDARREMLDAWGGLRVEAWLASPPIVPVDSIMIEADPLEQSIGVVERLGAIARDAGGEIDPDDVGLVLADEGDTDPLRRECEAAGIPLHRATGRSLASTVVARTLGVLAGWWDRTDTDALGAVIADPVLGRLVVENGDTGELESTWSTWASTHVPVAAGEGGPAITEPTLDAARTAFAEACDAVEASPLGIATGSILEILRRAVDGAARDWNAAVEALATAAAPIVEVPESLQPMVTPREACSVLLEIAASTSVPDPQDPAALETIGWLEAAFDPASNLVVVGMHDGAVPGDAEDPLLPDALRTSLGLDDEASRRARDLWILGAILGRDPHARFLLARRTLSGEPLVPSRLLFGDRGTELAGRVHRLFESPTVRRGEFAETSAFGRCRPPEPEATPPAPPASLSVTAFRTYLKSPYRYWVERVLRLRVDEPVGREFDPRTFGNVLHDAVETFGKAERDRQRRGESPTIDPAAIEEELVEALRIAAAPLIPAEPEPGIRLQMRILERRLAAIAATQAARTLEGWRIHEVEAPIRKSLDVPDQAGQVVTGRIDRIDRHDEQGWMVIDFKTSDRGDGPDRAHYLRTTGRWVDLQLPLYRWAAASMLPGEVDPEEIASAYFLAPADPGKIAVVRSREIDGRYEEAMETAREVVRSIRAGYFDDIGLRPPHGDDPLALFMRTQALAAIEEDD